MSKLGKYFSIREFTYSATAQRELITNVPDPRQMMAINYMVKHLLDPLRSELGRPVRITSGFRCQELNKIIGGSVTSQHMLGEAVDIKVADLDAEELATIIANSGLPFGQLIWYAAARGGHVHVSLRNPLHYRQMLSAPIRGGYTPWAP